MSIRINSLTKLDESYGKKTDTLLLRDYNLKENLDECMDTIQQYGIEHIHIQTRDIEFLKDPRLKNLKGIFLQYEVKDITPIFNFPLLTHLTIGEKEIKSFDYALFKNLLFLGGKMPKKYTNFEKLTKLKYTYLFQFKERDFQSFSNCSDLRKLEISSLNVENLNGLGHLKKLEEIHLHRCGQLKSLVGIGKENLNLKKVLIFNAKKLKNADALSLLPQLKEIRFNNIPQLYSLKFLEELNDIEELYIPPKSVGVIGDDYYPLVKLAKNKNLLHYLENWKPLESYLNHEFKIETESKNEDDELELIKMNLPFKNWLEKAEYGLLQYTEENCQKAENIFVNLMDQLKKNINASLDIKINLIKGAVLSINALNASIGDDFIETGEREELCALFDNIAEAAGINVYDYEEGIAYEWRDW